MPRYRIELRPVGTDPDEPTATTEVDVEPPAEPAPGEAPVDELGQAIAAFLDEQGTDLTESAVQVVPLDDAAG